MTYDFNDAESNSGFDLIPAGTIAPMIMTIRPGQAGDGGWLTPSNSSDYRYLNLEFVITDGPFAKRKFWGNMMVEHPRPTEERVAKTLGISRSKLRGILESARGIDPKDESDAAKAKRIVQGYGDFSGLEFVGKIAIQKGSGGYADKNELDCAVPVTSPDYAKAKSGAVAAPAAPKAPAAGVPSWAA